MINKTYDLSTMTAQEFLAEVAMTMDKHPETKLFTIRFLDAFREERIMQLELCYEREGKNTAH